MALNFPLNPSDGDTYQGYVYDATDGVWNANQGQIVSRFSTSATQPDSPSAGDGWFNPANGKTYIYYDGAWVESGNPVIGGVEPYDKTTSATGYFALPKGTTAQRPDTPQNGDIRFNTTLGEPEWYSENSSSWILFRNTPIFDVEYLLVAGGAGGGSGYGAGGGAGGLLSNTIQSSYGSSFTVTIGAGGAGSSYLNTGVSADAQGDDGSQSSIFSLNATGGGGGGGNDAGQNAANNYNGRNGGSGGGAKAYSTNTGVAGTGISGQGYDGGAAVSSQSGCGGGGGAAEAGAIGQNNIGANGGNGVEWPSGSGSYYAGGGGGSGSAGQGNGGLGGGGNANYPGDNATANTGGGGGGGQYYPSTSGTIYNGGNGGSGIAIIKYPASISLNVGAGLTYSTSTVGLYKITQFTAGTDTVTFS